MRLGVFKPLFATGNNGVYNHKKTYGKTANSLQQSVYKLIKLYKIIDVNYVNKDLG